MQNSLAKNSNDRNTFVRIKKPPGGDTNDIFNLGSFNTKRIQDKETAIFDFDKTAIGEKIKAYERDGNRKNSPKISEFDKENIIAVVKPLIQTKLTDEAEDLMGFDENLSDKVCRISMDDEQDDDTKSQNFCYRNPITGEMSKVEVPGDHFKLKDFSNKMKRAEKYSENTMDMGLSRPSIRVRQPPGGASTIFQF